VWVRQLKPLATSAALVAQHRVPVLSGPFNLAAQRADRFSEQELQALLQPT